MMTTPEDIRIMGGRVLLRFERVLHVHVLETTPSITAVDDEALARGASLNVVSTEGGQHRGSRLAMKAFHPLLLPSLVTLLVSLWDPAWRIHSSGAERIIQQVKCLPGKHEVLSLIHRTHAKNKQTKLPSMGDVHL